jgi:hypothetical protein
MIKHHVFLPSLILALFAITEATAASYSECINDCEQELRFCNSLVSGGLAPCKRACESDCSGLSQITNPFCLTKCETKCEHQYSSGLTQCSREYGTCSRKCNSLRGRRR